MPIKPQELIAVYRRERIRFDDSDTAILECEETEEQYKQRACVVAAKVGTPESCGEWSAAEAVNALLDGPATITIRSTGIAQDELVAGLTYRFYGHWSEHDKYGRQFRASSAWRVEPHDKDAVVRYLQSLCAGHGVGRATALALWDKFGGQAVKVLRTQPELAAAAVGKPHFTEAKAREAAAVLESEKATEETAQDLMGLLVGRGFPRDTIKKAIAEWGSKATAIAKRGYPLMAFRGCHFSICDQLYLDQGGNPAAKKRQALCSWYAVARADHNEGHTWFQPDVAEAFLNAKISRAEVQPVKAIKLAKRSGMLTVVRVQAGRPWIAEAKKAQNERTIAEHVRCMLKQSGRWPDAAGLDVSEHQRAGIEAATQAAFGALIGGPGTGKTHVLVQLCARIAALSGTESIAVSSFMGKAAARIGEVLTAAKLPIRATTTHRLLGVASNSATEGWGFAHDEENPLPYKWYLIDEASTYDVDLFAAFLRAVPAGGHVMIFGDTNQLPAIGHGAVLRDLISAGVPCGELREVRRNSGAIVAACADIRDGKPFRFSRELDPDVGENFVLERARDNEDAAEAIVRKLHRLPLVDIDPIWQTQVLVSVNGSKKGGLNPLSRMEINRRLQRELNPDGARAAGCPFRVGDKIIRMKKNTLMPSADSSDTEENADAIDGKVLVCNGEMGRVVQVENKRAFARFTGPKRAIVIPFGGSAEDEENSGDNEEATTTGCDFDLGYACTIHKSQGSEWPVVFLALDESGGAMRLGSRELFFTGISRGKFFDICFGKEYTAKAMCMRQVLNKRKTFLRELVSGEIPL